MEISADTVIDFFVISWIVSSVMLLLVFARYGLQSWQDDGPRETYQKLSFFNGLIVHHTGNLILLSWFWYKAHQKEISIPTNSLDRWILITGTAVAYLGVLYKVRIFTKSTKEVVFVGLVTVVLGILSVLSFEFHL